ncbi:STAS domain-containing protein [Streptomyces sp. NPDC006516]|uniref:STAS domain-containing protein n=1 Tax=Streptomyces sp. NPDC006516 TaxID=3154309 RepID=UPI0033A0EAC4
MTAHPFASNVMVLSGVARVTLVGELDLDTAPQVREAVTAGLAEQPVSLCLDLTGVSFCDCAGLSALLRARAAVLRAGVDLVVEGVGSQLARLLSLIGADHVFTGGNAVTNSEPTRASGTAAIRCDAELAATAADEATAAKKATAQASFRDLLA